MYRPYHFEMYPLLTRSKLLGNKVLSYHVRKKNNLPLPGVSATLKLQICEKGLIFASKLID